MNLNKNGHMVVCFSPDIFICLDISTKKELDLTKAGVLPRK